LSPGVLAQDYEVGIYEPLKARSRAQGIETHHQKLRISLRKKASLKKNKMSKWYQQLLDENKEELKKIILSTIVTFVALDPNGHRLRVFCSTKTT